jgi:hypothetical protein
MGPCEDEAITPEPEIYVTFGGRVSFQILALRGEFLVENLENSKDDGVKGRQFFVCKLFSPPYLLLNKRCRDLSLYYDVSFVSPIVLNSLTV